ncbi:hypothetical protein ACFQHO_38175 [Actinomadura yumaensis]|uniref:hypothetical protein n=1 Tax=Actinomadura yumaensis TaxID=111807 RepID=UPI00361D7321
MLLSLRQGWARNVECSASAAPTCGCAASSTVARTTASPQRISPTCRRSSDPSPTASA